MGDPSTDDTMLAEGVATSQSGEVATVIANRYRLLALVGRGGMGVVYRVRDEVLDEVVALKMLRRELLGSSDAIARFVQEVKLARKVTHPNVARTFDIGEHEGGRFLTMEWIAGESLAAHLAKGACTSADAVRFAASICAGVAAAHAVDVIHRDLKPENVLLASDGRVVVTDFGIARGSASANLTEGIVGTPAYMAPEQLEGKRVDARTDVYAIGEIFYEILTGMRAWPGEQPFVVAVAKLRDATPDPRRVRATVPDALAEIAMRCMERDPERRPASAADVLAALSSVARSPLPSVVPTDVPRRSTPAVTTLAVRSFENRGDPADDDIARGLSEDVLDTLSTVPGLRVRFAPATELDARALGRELGVDVVLEGTLRRDEDEARLSARVVSVVDGFQVWARRFVAPRAKLLRVADDVAMAVAEALAAHVAVPRRSAIDPLAVDSYLRARDAMRRVWFQPESDVGAIASLFDDALSRAPDEPTFLAASAVCLCRGTTPRLSLALERAERAIALAPHLADAWLALARVRIEHGDTLGAIAPAAEAYRRGPSLAEPVAFLGTVFDDCGPLDAARHYLRRACEIDPESTAAITLARAHYMLGELHDARHRLSLGSPSTLLIRATAACRFGLWSRDPTWVPAEAPAFATFALPRVLFELATTGAASAETLSAFRSLAGGTRPGRFRRFLSQIAVEVAVATNDPGVFDLLSASVDAGTSDLSWLERCPLFGPLRSDPRWGPLHTIVAGRAQALRDELERERMR